MSEQKLQKVGRIAFREEGNLWNAYWALPNTMEDAILIASVKMGVVRSNADLKQAFMEFVRLAASRLLGEQFGDGVAEWQDPVLAPVSEKSGNA
jgi:hypothetical protein